VTQATRQPPCPICGAAVQWADNPDRPFCSERCRLIDLARWADGTYAVPGPPALQTVDDPEET